jgi:hypothetical protein
MLDKILTSVGNGILMAGAIEVSKIDRGVSLMTLLEGKADPLTLFFLDYAVRGIIVVLPATFGAWVSELSFPSALVGRAKAQCYGLGIAAAILAALVFRFEFFKNFDEMIFIVAYITLGWLGSILLIKLTSKREPLVDLGIEKSAEKLRNKFLPPTTE